MHSMPLRRVAALVQRRRLVGGVRNQFMPLRLLSVALLGPFPVDLGLPLRPAHLEPPQQAVLELLLRPALLEAPQQAVLELLLRPVLLELLQQAVLELLQQVLGLRQPRVVLGLPLGLLRRPVLLELPLQRVLLESPLSPGRRMERSSLAPRLTMMTPTRLPATLWPRPANPVSWQAAVGLGAARLRGGDPRSCKAGHGVVAARQ